MSDAESALDPIIITGAPRTGVRLLAAILDGHPKLASGPDLPFPVTIARQWREIESTLGINHARHYGLQPDAVRAAFRATVLRLLAPRLNQTGKRRFVIHSFAAAVSVDALAALFPQARFIFMVRDPRDVAVSLLKCEWRNPRDGQRLSYTQDASAAARCWVDFMTIAQSSAAALLETNRLLRLRYEDLCTEPEETMRRLGVLLGEATPQASVGAESAALITASVDNPHPPLRTGAVTAADVGAWRETLPAHQLAAVDAITRAQRSPLGYH